jgi:hypothetical protein
MEKHYAKQIIEWAETAKETLTLRKEIIIDETITNEKLGEIVRMMYNAKVRAENHSIERCKQFYNE